MELFLNHACNLRCTYCYNNAQHHNPISDEVMQAALEMAFAAPAEIVNIDFSAVNRWCLLTRCAVAWQSPEIWQRNIQKNAPDNDHERHPAGR